VFQDSTENAIIYYACFDSRFLNDLVAIGLQLPEWAVAYWNKFTGIFQIFHLKVMAVLTKTTSMDATMLGEVTNYINTFPHKKSFPYKFPKDFSKATQEDTKCFSRNITPL
jgi:hypothetical protein